ncbi:hypothetical protein [Caulobacter sp. S45]|uniref:hypothetical protein n=1 Tax=Caulobacter sp. S45 TaxID=1641861 RepID=UPI00131D3EC4|nr:hypothetical protein [Caulobacter sp. S45]
MSDLLELVLDAHGGLVNWREVTTIDLRLTLRGRLLQVKQQPQGLQGALVKIATQRPRTLISPFPHPGARGLFENRAVAIQTSSGQSIAALDRPRETFAGHERTTPWTQLQLLYFIGYAFWNYFTTPFLLAVNGVSVVEIEPWEENGETWRVLQANFPEDLDTHCAIQNFYFNDKGLLQRHDYFTDVGRGSAAHYVFDHATFDGFIFPTHRRVVPRGDGNIATLSAPSTFMIDLESVIVSTG